MGARDGCCWGSPNNLNVGSLLLRDVERKRYSTWITYDHGIYCLTFGNGYQFTPPEYFCMQTMMKNLLQEARHFALCESCFWSATILRMNEGIACPACTDSNVSLIPLAMDEQYRIELGTSAGLELSFSKRSR